MDKLNPDARALLRTMTVGAPLEEVARAVSLAPTEHAFVERIDGLYRWSPAHPGGAYALHREVTRMLGLDHRRVPTPFITLERYAVARDPNLPPPSVWTILAVRRDEVPMAREIREALDRMDPTARMSAIPCPRCGGRDLMEILYGEPWGDMAERASRGEFGLGGCVIVPAQPTHVCRSCGALLRRTGDAFDVITWAEEP